MAASQNIRAGKAYVELGVSDKLTAGLKAAQARLKSFGSSIRTFGLNLAGIGGAILAPLGIASKAFADYGSQLNDTAARTGMSVEALSELGYAAQQSGTDLATLEVAARKMQKAITEAANGSKSANETLSNLGMSVQELVNLSPDQQFESVADALSGISDPTQRAALAMELFGRSGTALLPMVADMDQLRDKARQLGLTMSTETAAQADALGDAFDDVKATVRSVTVALGGALAPALTAIAEGVSRVLASISKFLQKNQQTVLMVAKIAAAAIAAGGALVALGTGLIGLAKFGGIVATVLVGVKTAVLAIGSGFAAAALPVATLAVAGYAVYRALQQIPGVAAGIGDKLRPVFAYLAELASWVGARFGELYQTASSTIGGIADALAAGDVKAASDVLWAGLKLAWLQGAATLKAIWYGVKETVIGVAYEMWFGTLKGLQWALYGIESAWNATISALKTAWNAFSTWHQNTVETLANWMAKTWIDMTESDPQRRADAKASIDQQSSQRYQEIEQDSKNTQQRIDADYDSKREKAEQEHTATIAELNRQLAAAKQQMQDADNSNIVAAQDAVSDAQAKLATALANAKQARQEFANMSMPNLPGGNIPEIASSIVQKVSVTGTFNAAAAGGLASSSAAERTAQASEETARHTRKLSEAARTGRLTFT